MQTFLQQPGGLLAYPTWWLGRDGQWRAVEVEDGATMRGRGLIAKLAGCDDREAATALRGTEVALPREMLPAGGEGEYYWADLQGLQVRNLDGVPLGVVTGLLEAGANQVLVVRAERERLIPFVEAVVKSVDLTHGAMVVDWGVDF
ncbi:MAG: ribosome maturation factor RimM [Burkholderiales bacterium]|nr:ribosome maturation factor RimM [Burkholderiales bacterium]